MFTGQNFECQHWMNYYDVSGACPRTEEFYKQIANQRVY